MKSQHDFQYLRDQIMRAFDCEPRTTCALELVQAAGIQGIKNYHHDWSVVQKRVMKVTETRPQGKSKELVPHHTKHKQNLVQTIKTLPDEIQRYWLQCCYAGDPNPGRFITLQFYVINTFLAEQETNLHEKSVKAARHLATFALLHEMCEAIGVAKPFTYEQLATRLNISPDNWARHWRPRIRHMRDIIYKLDAAALKRIDRLTSSKKQTRGNQRENSRPAQRIAG